VDKHEDGPLLRPELAERPAHAVPLRHDPDVVGHVRAVSIDDRDDPRRVAALPVGRAIAGTHDEPVQPGVEPVRVAQADVTFIRSRERSRAWIRRLSGRA
jgi:hypothetical protein